MNPHIRMSITLGEVGWRYAQRKSGQKLHIVQDFGNGTVAAIALCGAAYPWRMTINVPMAHACHNCWRIREGLR